MDDHKLVHVERYAGTRSSFYIAQCSCGWMSGDCRSEEAAEEAHRDHVDGRQRPLAPGLAPPPPEGW